MLDDLIYTSDSESMLMDFKATMEEEFLMTDLGMMMLFLGVEVIQDGAGIFTTQRKYAAETVKEVWYGGLQSCSESSCFRN